MKGLIAMAKKKASIPKYGTVTRNGVSYYRTRIMDADGKQMAEIKHRQPAHGCVDAQRQWNRSAQYPSDGAYKQARNADSGFGMRKSADQCKKTGNTRIY